MGMKSLIENRNPFGALLGVSALIAALLYVAGFTCRWSYYYNFGIQHLVFSLNFQSFLITAIELIRLPKNFFITLIALLFPLIVINGLLRMLHHFAQKGNSSGRLQKTAKGIISLLALDSPLVIDAIRAVVLFYMTFMLSAQIGYARYQEHIVNDINNPLPAVSLVFEGREDSKDFTLQCGADSDASVHVIGDIKKINTIRDAYRTCNSPDITWRLLYRDSDAIYLFASRPAGMQQGKRPLTLIVPNDGHTFLVME